MRDRINGMRKLFVDTLKAKGVDRDFSFITRQKGMFSFSGLTKDQVNALRERYALYIVGSGRINVAGMTDANITAANGHVGTGYLGTGVDIVMTHPIDPGVVGSANGASMDSICASISAVLSCVAGLVWCLSTMRVVNFSTVSSLFAVKGLMSPCALAWIAPKTKSS